MGRIALVRRWDTLFGLSGAVAAYLIVFAGGGLLALLLVTQTSLGLQLLRNRILSRRVERENPVRISGVPERAVLDATWPAAWRTSLGSAGVVIANQSGGLLFAQLGAPAAVASYLIALRMLEAIGRLSRAPFYARLPILARLRAQARVELYLEVAKRGMSWSYWLFVVGIAAVATFGPWLFAFVRSEVPFPSRLIWFGLGLALFFERYGAMHLQLVATANRIIAPAAMAGYVIVNVAALALLVGILGVHALPLAMLCGYLGWFSWYCARQSYTILDQAFWSFERTTVLPPFFALLLVAGAAYAFR
jgi:hypothetical protein